MSARTPTRPILLVALLCALSGLASGQAHDGAQASSTAEAEPPPRSRAADSPDFNTMKRRGARRSRYLAPRFNPTPGVAPASDLTSFREDIEPILAGACLPCHGPQKERGGLRLDALDPDLVGGEDVDDWLDVLSVLSNGEMPPEGEAELAGEDRGSVIEWLSTEVQRASMVRRGSRAHSTLRRMTRYEYEYALQDLLGLPFGFADDLPPDPTSEDGFQNSSDVLHLSPMQLRATLESNRKALRAATVRGEQPTPLVWSISIDEAAAIEWARQDGQLEDARKKHADDPNKLEAELERLRERFAKRPNGVHYESLVSGRLGRQTWHYGGAKYAWAPAERPALSAGDGAIQSDGVQGSIDHVAVVPRRQGLIVELGERIPEEGTLRVRVRASRADAGSGPAPSLALDFGWQASNDSRAVVRVSETDLPVLAAPGSPEVYEFRVPLREVSPRNWVRETATLGGLPSPSEYVKLVNASMSGGALRIHHVEVVAPVHEQWPPASHLRVFPKPPEAGDERAWATEVLGSFMSRAWRRQVSPGEVRRKLELYERLRPEAESTQDAMIEALATVLSSPHFLYVGAGAAAPIDTPPGEADSAREGAALATRLSMFLWCSTPDDELLALAETGQLSDPATLLGQVERMLDDPRSRRFSKHFVRQWLGLSLLDYLHVDRKAYPKFDGALAAAMGQEPVEFFHEILTGDLSALEFLHADFTMANERLAAHYGLNGVEGNHFRRVAIDELPHRGGLLTQAGLLAMNSDGKDSHPLKRGVWMLERLLDDPPPPPPPAVPEIDLADPEIAKMTLKERIEDHRSDPACVSCHAKIDPWGIAFENYDATGSWRTDVQGTPVDARSVLFNGQELDGMHGLKRFLLENRQDQFVSAMVHKLATFALGRPLSFEDRAAVEGITAEARRRGDRLATMVKLIATSELFRSN